MTRQDKGAFMNNIAQSRAKVASTALSGYALPALLAGNAFALFALEQLGAIPTWIKTAAALFLAF
jgi:hypothetical protein